jgi:hypothetical protein
MPDWHAPSPSIQQPAIAVFPGAEWTPASRRANRDFCSYLRSRLPASQRLLIRPPPIPSLWTTPEKQHVVIVAFSFGVVQAATFAALLPPETMAGSIAVDGWCVPLRGPWPIYRLSHDLPTHRNGLRFGGGDEQFFAAPEVNHLQLWSQPHQVWGWSCTAAGHRRTTAACFLMERLGCPMQV